MTILINYNYNYHYLYMNWLEFCSSKSNQVYSPSAIFFSIIFIAIWIKKNLQTVSFFFRNENLALTKVANRSLFQWNHSKNARKETKLLNLQKNDPRSRNKNYFLAIECYSQVMYPLIMACYFCILVWIALQISQLFWFNYLRDYNYQSCSKK